MIDALTKLLDLFTKLAKSKKEIEYKTWERLIQPLFRNLEVIHKDYLAMFESVRKDIEKGTPLKTIAERLGVQRLKEESLRRSTLEFAWAYYKNPKLSKYEGFFKAVSQYLDSVPVGKGHDTPSRMLLSLLSFGERREDIEDLRQHLHKITMGLLATSRGLWRKASREYATLAAEQETG